MDNRPAPLRWTHWTRFLLIPICFFLLVGALVQQGQDAGPAVRPGPGAALSGVDNQ